MQLGFYTFSFANQILPSSNLLAMSFNYLAHACMSIDPKIR